MITVTLWALILFHADGSAASTWTHAPHYATQEECEQARSWSRDTDNIYVCVPQSFKVPK